MSRILDVDSIVLGGEWRDGRREYASGLVGTAGYAGPIFSSPACGWWHLLPQTMPKWGSWGTQWQTDPPTLGEQALLRLAESACDHAARVFLAGCLTYALPLLAGELERLAGKMI